MLKLLNNYLKNYLNKKLLMIGSSHLIQMRNKYQKITNLRDKIVGGYYPVNYEIDDLDILGRLEKKKITISLPSIKKNYKLYFQVF